MLSLTWAWINILEKRETKTYKAIKDVKAVDQIVDAGEIDRLRKELKERGIKYHHKSKAPKLQKQLDAALEEE